MVSSTLANEKVDLCRFALPFGAAGRSPPTPDGLHARAGGSDTDLSDPPVSAEVLTHERGSHLGSFHTMLLKRAVPP